MQNIIEGAKLAFFWRDFFPFLLCGELFCRLRLALGNLAESPLALFTKWHGKEFAERKFLVLPVCCAISRELATRRGCHRCRCSRRPMGGAHASHSEAATAHLHKRAAAARARASRATKTVIAGHDLAIFERTGVGVPQKNRLPIVPLHP